MRRGWQALFPLFLAVLLTACFDPAKKAVPTTALPVPSKDEILLVNGRKLSLTGYMILRERFPALSREDLLWIATASLAIQNDTQSHGKEMNAPSAVVLTRYAMNEADPQTAEPLLREYYSTAGNLPSAQEFRAQLDRLISQSIVQRNPQVLAELH